MTYTSCFIGIPLPSDYNNDFAGLVNTIAQLDPSIRPANPRTPHITLYYLSLQSQYAISDIASELERTKNALATAHVTVGGLGVFGGDDPKVLFLKAECSSEIIQANKQYTDLFDAYYARDNTLPFHPHMTLAKLPDEAARAAFKQNQAKIEEVANVAWQFPVTEIVIYGVDSTQDPEVHQRLHVVEVSGALPQNSVHYTQ